MNSLTAKENRVNGPADRHVERGFVLPEADVVETKESFLVTLEMPGVNKAGLDLTLEANVLTIVGHRADFEATDKGKPLLRESQRLDYRRVFELAPALDAKNISATIEDGVLTVKLPKGERVKPKKIPVNA